MTYSLKKSNWILWHRRLGYLSSIYLSKLNNQDTNIDLDVPESEKSCEECDLSNAT